MPKQSRPIAIVLILACFAAGCTKISRMLGKGGTEYTVRVETQKPNKADIVDLAVKIIGSRLAGASIDGEVTRVPDTADEISVKVYGDQEWERVKEFLFETHDLGLKKVISASYPSQLTT
ncbi:MAG: hypothetical protein ACRD43_13770, partial [Pyrinomonadaceae bacterium]